MDNKNTPTLLTERLILRKFNEFDLKSVYDIYSNIEVNNFLPWHPIKDINEAKVILENNYLNKYKNELGFDYAICLKENNIPIGYIKISMNDTYDLGYALLKEYWNKGITTEAAKAVLQIAKQEGIPYITATHDINNKESGSVMIKVGMEYKYSYIELWQPKNYNVTFRMYQINFTKNKDFIYKKYWNNSKEKMIEKI